MLKSLLAVAFLSFCAISARGGELHYMTTPDGQRKLVIVEEVPVVYVAAKPPVYVVQPPTVMYVTQPSVVYVPAVAVYTSTYSPRRSFRYRWFR